MSKSIAIAGVIVVAGLTAAYTIIMAGPELVRSIERWLDAARYRPPKKKKDYPSPNTKGDEYGYVDVKDPKPVLRPRMSKCSTCFRLIPASSISCPICQTSLNNSSDQENDYFASPEYLS